jgi:hypothetical protein
VIDTKGDSELVIALLGLLFVEKEWLGDCDRVPSEEDDIENELVDQVLMDCVVDIVGELMVVRVKDERTLSVLDWNVEKERMEDLDVDFEESGERLNDGDADAVEHIVTVAGCLDDTVGVKVADGDTVLVSRELGVREIAGEWLSDELVEIDREIRDVDDSSKDPELDDEMLGERNADLDASDVRETCVDGVDERVTNGEIVIFAEVESERDKAGLWEDERDIIALWDTTDDDDGDFDDWIDREPLALEDLLRVASVEWLVVVDGVVECDKYGETDDDAVVELDEDIRPEFDDVALVLIDGEVEAHLE